MNKTISKDSNKIAFIIAFGILLIIAFLLSNAKGSMNVSMKRILEVIINNDGSAERLVIWNIRLPRTIVAGLVGVNLALSGCILQGVMRNPLADPGIIGISSGAGLAGIIILILFPKYQMLVPPFAFVGAMGAAIMIYVLSWKGGIQPIRVILAGVAVSTLLGAGISALMVFFSDRVHGALMFMNGGLSARSWPELWTILPYTIIGLIILSFMSEKLNILILGDDIARGVGLNVELVRFGLTAVAAMLAASAVSVVGLLGFVGLIIPHSVRLMVGNDYKYLIPGSSLLGAAVVMLSDTFARTVLSPVEIPVGIVMAILGVPFFLYLLRKD
ncbi:MULTISPECIES: FecCD family ABC transporter permease [Vallitalea]|uniref:Iron ABC transporter permease n=2 Tax=Vallitalea TaxID=1348611 RepID=A0A8J8MBR3_9FIRM|nr:iron ABC transporter permease [Vallitalea guaymasensis]QUH30032.1 iron ABC transporter permease [Vallitalea guaymasensis]GMQ64095.1 iron ABC transporter permease [Vallitalea sp. AN17-2]